MSVVPFDKLKARRNAKALTFGDNKEGDCIELLDAAHTATYENGRFEIILDFKVRSKDITTRISAELNYGPAAAIDQAVLIRRFTLTTPAGECLLHLETLPEEHLPPTCDIETGSLYFFPTELTSIVSEVWKAAKKQTDARKSTENVTQNTDLHDEKFNMRLPTGSIMGSSHIRIDLSSASLEISPTPT